MIWWNLRGTCEEPGYQSLAVNVPLPWSSKGEVREQQARKRENRSSRRATRHTHCCVMVCPFPPAARVCRTLGKGKKRNGRKPCAIKHRSSEVQDPTEHARTVTRPRSPLHISPSILFPLFCVHVIRLLGVCPAHDRERQRFW